MFNPIPRPELIVIAGLSALFVSVLEMVRRGRLREDYSLMWLGTSAVLIILAIFRDTLLDPIAGLLGIFYPPTALFVLGFGAMLLLLLQFSMVITKLSKQNKQAAQHIAMLGMRIRELERRLEVEQQSKGQPQS